MHTSYHGDTDSYRLAYFLALLGLQPHRMDAYVLALIHSAIILHLVTAGHLRFTFNNNNNKYERCDSL